jgi:hypothetical protein
MANALQVKTDVVNELKNKLYYNQLELGRLVNNPTGISHREVVDTVLLYLRENVLAIESINLIESYIQEPQQAKQAPAEIEASPVVDEASVGIKKID